MGRKNVAVTVTSYHGSQCLEQQLDANARVEFTSPHGTVRVYIDAHGEICVDTEGVLMVQPRASNCVHLQSGGYTTLRGSLRKKSEDGQK